ncbi:hypothetical protein HOLleu_01221 [Holothuria leucospilota]|uniref:DNA-directed DNA polymerase n=1 Tax=Holothuria leucospilota TaxID=206669 RepID=A0A9Q1CNR8_HOLLE|nr:hypothetical protein HOLleu_01221 [Holothuria leucospilota]
MLNSFWGKFGQREDLVKTINEPSRLYDLLKDEDKTELKNVRFINDDVLEAHYQENEKFTPPNPRVNVVIAAFTTCHARLKLYDVIYRMHERVLYFDTDSIIYISKPDYWEPPTCYYLGELTNEINPKDGNYIQSFVTGPKNYAFTLDIGKTVCKVRGITLNNKTSLKVNYDTLFQMVQNIRAPTVLVVSVHDLRKIRTDITTKQIVNKSQTKAYRVVYDKRIILDDFTTLPYGYHF